MNNKGYTNKRRRGFQMGNTAQSPKNKLEQIAEAAATVSPTATSSSNEATVSTDKKFSPKRPRIEEEDDPDDEDTDEVDTSDGAESSGGEFAESEVDTETDHEPL